jgi:hypothetical protein
VSCKSPFDNLYHRLVSNIHEPENEQACWVWKRRLGKGAYARFDVYIPGLLGNVSIQAHVALWVWLETQPESIDDFYLYYREFITSGLELDHLCVNPPCISPEHMEPVTPAVNSQRRDQRNGYASRRTARTAYANDC